VIPGITFCEMFRKFLLQSNKKKREKWRKKAKQNRREENIIVVLASRVIPRPVVTPRILIFGNNVQTRVNNEEK
jgi:hypothetical protein